MACSGNEPHLSACIMEFSKNTSSPCPAGGPAAVSCMPGSQFTQGHGHKHKQNRTVSSNLLPLEGKVATVESNFTRSFSQSSGNVWNGFVLNDYYNVGVCIENIRLCNVADLEKYFIQTLSFPFSSKPSYIKLVRIRTI